MTFLGYWSAWSILLFFLCTFKKIRFTDGHGRFSLFALLFFAFLLAIPASLIHYAFKDLRFILIIFGVVGVFIMFKQKVMSKYQVQAKQMPIMEYAEELYNGNDFDQVFDEMLRSGGYNEKMMLDFIISEAKHKGITLLKNDLDEDALHEMYKAAEKGLS